VNIVAVVGNVASEPELRHTSQGRAICTFRVAVSRPGGEQADFFTVAAWERQAEVCNQYLAIGRRVAIDGRMHCCLTEAPDGEHSSRIEIVAHRVELLGRPAEAPKMAEVAR
jgi:single-strand DNA-binding protein